MKRIPLTKGQFALVDNEDFNKLSKHRWFAQKRKHDNYVAIRGCKCPLVRQSHSILMHRQIMLCPLGLQIDHIDHNTLNNQKANLRICTNQQNSMNQRRRKGTSKYKGVSWSKEKQKWYSCIKVNYKTKFLGRFNSEAKAAKEYDIAAKEYFGEFAYLNFPD